MQLSIDQHSCKNHEDKVPSKYCTICSHSLCLSCSNKHSELHQSQGKRAGSKSKESSFLINLQEFLQSRNSQIKNRVEEFAQAQSILNKEATIARDMNNYAQYTLEEFQQKLTQFETTAKRVIGNLVSNYKKEV